MSLEEKYYQKDRIVRGVDPDGYFKIAVAKTTNVVREVSRRHSLSLLNKVILGRALTGASILASDLKGEERIQLHFEGDGPIGRLTAEGNSTGEVRGYVQNPQAELNPEHLHNNMGAGLGSGLLQFSKTLYNESQPRTSTTQLQKGDVTQDLAFYMVQSEQVPSGVKLDVGMDDNGEVNASGGIIIQRMPGAPDDAISELQENLENLESVNELLNQGFYIDSIMQKAMKPFEVKELTRYPVDFFCRCSRDRFKNALYMLGHEELKDMEGEPQVLVCHYCNEHYFFPKDEIQDIAEQSQAKLN